MPKLHVTTIILTYNSRATIEACIASVYASTGPFTLDCIVVDNASLDDSAAFLRQFNEKYPFTFIESPKNKGFAAGVNIGLKEMQKSLRTQRTTAPKNNFTFLLNPDTKIQADTMAQLIAFLEAHPRAGIVEPQMRYPDGRMQSSNFGRFPTRHTELFHAFKLHKVLPFGRYVVPHGLGKYYFKKPRQFDWVGGGAMFMRAEVPQEIGLFDERYFLYIEDIDFCRRARSAGYEIWYNPDVVITHVLSASFQQPCGAQKKSTQRSFEQQSLRYYFEKWGNV
ncbi:MAG: Glycosyl transferase family 2 [Parcubacteria group bacterium GW2011_GWA2_47_8]|nr:MAG: Glycosyl transferase family 2 [Parcubacteria group bacterium GW2011_GWA2_47_8]OHB18699.1 MAG: hypothetical protein A2666_02480 [Parcubacteria group bacterium RIFCSPHIGHO2_01_FULL_47_10b]